MGHKNISLDKSSTLYTSQSLCLAAARHGGSFTARRHWKADTRVTQMVSTQLYCSFSGWLVADRIASRPAPGELLEEGATGPTCSAISSVRRMVALAM